MFILPIRDSAPRKRLPLVVPLLILANCLIYVYVVESWMAAEKADWLFDRYGVRAAALLQRWGSVSEDPGLFWEDPGNFLQVGVLRLFTYQFLHAGPMHLLGNMVFLWIFGDNIEDRLGRIRFLVFYLLCGVLAVLTHCWMRPGGTAPVVGASGAIAALLGSYLVLYPRERVTLLVWVILFFTFVEIPAWLLLIPYFALQFEEVQNLLAIGSSQGIAWWAHIGGFLAGIGLLPLFLIGRRRDPEDR